MDGLTERWEAALETRRAMNPRSPVLVLDELLKGGPASATWPDPMIFPRDSPRRGLGGASASPQAERTAPDLQFHWGE